jgi:AraC family transcriptional regulator of adaptative response/methylated-DNA-[protein]-cysteine methyltransferase
MIALELDSDECWSAAIARDRSYDGRFVSGVLSTGIYCRPSCPARHPKRENVRFFATPAEARAAGLRACLRCSPDDVSRDERAVLSAITAIKGAGQPLALAALAEETGYSPSHFQRVFSRHTGLSPAAYARALMAERAAQALSDEGSVTEAVPRGARITVAIAPENVHAFNPEAAAS